MTTKVKATCPDCGDVFLTVRRVTVVDMRWMPDWAYRFRCPKCRRIVFDGADARVSELLTSAGAKVAVVDAPAEPAERPNGPPITHDELIDFHARLAGEDRVERLARWTPGQPS
jgi:predicted RNA-binding Zn-ribbon protein involved in translation (DUF1610 family)